MKKQILFAFFASLVLLLGGCGSNDKVDGGGVGLDTTVLKMDAAPLVPAANNVFSIHIPIVKNTKYKVTLSGIMLVRVGGCEIDETTIPRSLEFEGNVGEKKWLDISGVFKNDCHPGEYSITFKRIVTDGTRSRSENVTYDSGVVASGGGGGTSGDSEYYFSNAKVPEKISVAKKSYELKVQLAKGSAIVSGKEIAIQVFSNTYGDLTAYKAETGADGYATFSYISPDVLPANGASYTLTAKFMDESNITISKPLLLIFDTNGSTTGDINTSLPIAIVPATQRTVALTNNGQSVDIAVRVYKDTAPYTEGEVKVELPSEVLNGVDVGSFSAYSVPVDDQGVALFHYTGPGNLQALIDDNHLGSAFKFYHSGNSSPEVRQPMNVVYQPGDDYVPIDYRMVITTQNNDFSMGIPDLTKTFNVVLQKSDGSDLGSADATITSVTVQTENASVGQLYDTASGTLVDSQVLQNIKSAPFYIKSKKLSGIVPVRARIAFNDVNGDAKVLETIVNVRVMSGPPSAISVSYLSTGLDSARGKYNEKFAVSVVDEYGNSVNTKPYISLGAITGYAVDGRESSGVETNETKRLFYGRSDIENDIANGSLDNMGDTDPHSTQFEALIRPDVFRYVNAEGPNTDKLVVFGAGKNYEAMGKWDFSRINDTTLNLEDDYYGSDRNGLYYAIGRNYYQDQCRQDGSEWIGSAASDTYQLDDQGTVVIDYKYDYHLAGKDVMVWVNLSGIQPDTGKKTRIGEVIKHTLRSTGLVQVPANGYTLKKGTSGLATFAIWHENVPERYRNAHFGYAIKSGSTCHAVRAASSNDFDARTCTNHEVVSYDDDNNASTPDASYSVGSSDGTSYVTYYISAPATEDCTFNIDRIMVSSEF